MLKCTNEMLFWAPLLYPLPEYPLDGDWQLPAWLFVANEDERVTLASVENVKDSKLFNRFVPSNPFMKYPLDVELDPTASLRCAERVAEIVDLVSVEYVNLSITFVIDKLAWPPAR